jgi:D-arabinose 1-dehydrogenase-like Zn-dependent alcohol dehydrogenase
MSSSTTSARKETMMEAVEACRNGGMVVAMGCYVDPTLEIPSYDIVICEKQVVGTRALTRMEFREIVQLVNSGTSVPDIGELVPIS